LNISQIITGLSRLLGQAQDLPFPCKGLRGHCIWIWCLWALATSGCGGVTSTRTTVPMIQTTTILSASPAVVIHGATVTLSASVTYPPAETASGLVHFSDGDVALSSQLLDAQGVAVVKVQTLAVGTHTITARFAGTDKITASMSRPAVVSVLAPSMTDASSLVR
jgi:hypothetical protein